MEKIKQNINAAMARIKAELVLKNVSIINVYTQSIEKNDIAISNDTIVGIGRYEGKEEIDCEGLFAAPGFIDAHVHIESSMVTPEIFSNLVIKRGVTSVVADPHEIANVLGEEGLQFMLENSKRGSIDTFFMLPSCVPAVEFEDNGAVLKADKLEKFINDARVLGLGEVMDVNAVTSCNETMLDKLAVAATISKNLDGHCPRVSSKELNAYICAGIRTDHECSTAEEAIEKVSRGMYIMIREGSAARNLIDLLPAVNDINYHRFLFCTDDRHIEDLIETGTIDNCIRLAVNSGLDPVKAITMASYNPAVCYNLRDRGAIAPGMKADIVLLEDLEKLKIRHVIKSGELYSDGKESKIETLRSTINVNKVDKDMFSISCRGNFINVIKVKPGSLETAKVTRKAINKDGFVCGLEQQGDIINKVAIIERHTNSGKFSIGYIEGLGIKGAAIAQSIAHDSHNIIVVGDSEEDMAAAVNCIIQEGGGIAIAAGGQLLEYLSLPIAGLMTSENPEHVLNKTRSLDSLARKYGVKKEIDPFLTLAFMALPVIPDIKITPRGLFDYCTFNFIDLFTE